MGMGDKCCRKRGGGCRWVVGGRPGACEIELEIKIKHFSQVN